MSDPGQTAGGAGQPLFAPRVMIWVFALGVLLFLSSLYFLAEPSPERRLDRHGARATSGSAIGYQALVRLLRALDVPVEVSGRLPTADRLGSRLLIVTDQEALFGDTSLVLRVRTARQVLLILPKWQGEADPERPTWLRRVRLLDRDIPQSVLSGLDPNAKIVRPSYLNSWALGPLPAKPDLPQPQVIASSQLEAVIATAQGVLLGRLAEDGDNLWLLSDPDLLSNHGLKRQDDPAVPLAMLRHLLGGELDRGPGVLFLDLTLKSEPPPGNLFEGLFRFPAVIVTLQVVIACLLAGWAATARFGRPLERGRSIQAGKRVLVENGAALLGFGGHQRSVVRRYFDITVTRAALRLNAPRGLNRKQQFDWLCDLSRERGLESTGQFLKRRIDTETAKPLSEQRAVALAQLCDHWKRELLHVFGDHPRNR